MQGRIFQSIQAQLKGYLNVQLKYLFDMLSCNAHKFYFLVCFWTMVPKYICLAPFLKQSSQKKTHWRLNNNELAFLSNYFLHIPYDIMLKVNTNSIALKDDILTLSATLQGLWKKLYQIIYVKFYSICVFSAKNKNVHKSS